MAKELTREEYLKLREGREDMPGIVVIGGHVVSDRFGEKYGTGKMPDEELPISLKTQDIDYPPAKDTKDAKRAVRRRPRK